MKITFLFGSLNRGGTETLMFDVCQNLKKSDFDAIGVYRKEGVLEVDFLNSGVPFFKLSVGKNKLKYLFSLRKLLRDHEVEIIHAQQPLDALYAKIASIGLAVKIILTFHGFDFEGSNSLIKFIIRKTDKNIFVSKYQQDYYIAKYRLEPNKQAVIYNGVNFHKLDNSRLQGCGIRDELKINKEILLLGMVGNFNNVRDHFTVCQFLDLLNQKGVDFHFLFVGKRIEEYAERYDECVEFCENNNLTHQVSFLGIRDDVPRVLSQLDAFVYSTEHDTFGIAVVEAMASGIPTFVNDWEVMSEITDGGKSAEIYKTKTPNDLLEKFLLFLQDKEKYTSQAKENAAIVREKFSIEKHIENLKELYKTP